MNFLKKFSPLVLGFILFAGTAFAQGQAPQVQPAEDVSDEELEMFVSLAIESQAIQRDVNMKMQQAIQAEENISMQRFQVIQQSKQNAQMADSITVTDEEQEAISNLEPKLQEIGQNAQTRMQTLMSENELTQQRLQQLQMALQSDTELQKRFQAKLMEMQQENSEG